MVPGLSKTVEEFFLKPQLIKNLKKPKGGSPLIFGHFFENLRFLRSSYFYTKSRVIRYADHENKGLEPERPISGPQRSTKRPK